MFSTDERNYVIDANGGVKLHLSAWDYAGADDLAEFADSLLSQKRSGDGWIYYDREIGVTRGIALSVSDYASDNGEQALNETNRAFILDWFRGNDEHGENWDEGYISGFGGTYDYTVRVYEPACVDTDGDHDMHVDFETEHGYESVPGFEDSIIVRCRECGVEYVDEEITHRTYTQALMAAYDLVKALEEYPILDESAYSDREWELVDEDLGNEIAYWKNDQEDLTDEQANAVVDMFRNLDYLPEGIDPNGWDHVMVTEYVITDGHYVDADAVVKVLNHCKEEWYVNRGREHMDAQIEGQMAFS